MTLIKMTLHIVGWILWTCFCLAFCLVIWKGCGIILSAGVFNILLGALFVGPIVAVCCKFGRRDRVVEG